MLSELSTQFRDFSLQALLFSYILNYMEEFFRFKRLGQVIISSVFHGFNGGLHRSVASHHDHLDGMGGCLYPFEKLQTVYSGHADVHQHDIAGCGLNYIQGGLAVSRSYDVIAMPSKQSNASLAN